MSEPLRRGARWSGGAVLVAAALLLPACSSSSAPPPSRATGPTCPATASGPLLTGSTGTIQVGAHTGAAGRSVGAELLRIDATSGGVAARCVGATALTVIDPGTAVTNHQPIPTLAAVTGTVLPAFAGSSEQAPVSATALTDWRTGTRSAITFAGWHIVSVVARGVLLQSDASARAGSTGYVTAPTDAGDFCVLPSITAARSRCAQVPGATGSGFPRVRTDGSLGWVPTRLVPATFDDLHGYALTDGSGIVAFGTSRTSVGGPGADERYLTSLDGRAVLDAVPGSAPVRWMTVDRVDGSGVHGTLHTSSVPRTRFLLAGVGNHGFVVSPDGRTLHVLDDDVTDPTDRANLTLWTVTEGSSTVRQVTIRAPGGDALGGAQSSLIWWPTAAPAA